MSEHEDRQRALHETIWAARKWCARGAYMGADEIAVKEHIAVNARTLEYVETLRGLIAIPASELAALRAEVERGRKALDYCEHDDSCVLSYCSGGRLRDDGGYEHQYRGEWYQVIPVNNTPKCECGLSDILASMQAPVAEKEGEKDE